MAEHQLPKLIAWVRFPSPAPNIKRMMGGVTSTQSGRNSHHPLYIFAPIAQLAERIHGKDEVSSSNLDGSSKKKWRIGFRYAISFWNFMQDWTDNFVPAMDALLKPAEVR